MASAPDIQPSPGALSSGRRGAIPGDRLFLGTIAALVVVVVLILVFLALQLLRDSMPTWQTFGLSFIFSQEWNPPQEIFGAALFIYGTIVTSIIALVLSTPFALGASVYLVEYAPPRVADPVA